MAKDPAFLFYPGDWQGGTLTFTRFLKGCYMDLLIAQFNNGHLSLEEIKTVLGSDFGQAWSTLQKKFRCDEVGLFFNVKLESEMIRRQEYSKSRSRNRKSKDMNNISKTHEESYVKHMETGNETGIRIGSISKEFPSDILKNDELCIESLAREASVMNIDLQKCMDDWDGWYCSKFPGWRSSFESDKITFSDIRKSFESWLRSPKSKNGSRVKISDDKMKKFDQL